TFAIGSEGYVPEEQRYKKPELNSDIYTIGIIAIEALIGCKISVLPLDKNGEIFWQHLVNVNPTLSSIIAKMVRKDYRVRYQNVNEVLKDLEILKNLPSQTPQKENIYYNHNDIDSYIEEYSSSEIDYSPIEIIDSIILNDANFYYNCGHFYYQQEKYDLAEADYSKAIEINSNVSDYYYWRGRSRYEQGEYSLAQLDYTKAIEIDPDNADYYHWLNLCQEKEGQHFQDNTISWKVKEIKSLNSSFKTQPIFKLFNFEVISLNSYGEKLKIKNKQAKYFTEDLGHGVILDMVAIPSGKFIMGASEQELDSVDSERPQHQVNVSSFFMGRYPITQAQWKVVAGWGKVEIDLDPDPSLFKEDYEGITRWNRPVELVSWDDAIEFCKRLSKRTGREYRLPSEAQWEYACRADTTTPFHFGETISTELANYRDNETYGEPIKGECREQTTPVGYFKVANNFGLYDMHGNVFEWCEDDWYKNYDSAPNDGTAWISAKGNKKVVRSSSWFAVPSFCRSAFRDGINPGYRSPLLGFRVVRLAPRSS
ncbi:MAG: SUMF1/EgtB/PvdO family nonheme iron enzyme, partial [Prochloraceae cyanobacterium]